MLIFPSFEEPLLDFSFLKSLLQKYIKHIKNKKLISYEEGYSMVIFSADYLWYPDSI